MAAASQLGHRHRLARRRPRRRRPRPVTRRCSKAPARYQRRRVAGHLRRPHAPDPAPHRCPAPAARSAGASIPGPAAAPPPAQDPDAIYIDLDWLHEQYLTWHRTLADIAAEAGCTTAALKQFAHEHGVPVRPEAPAGYISPATAAGRHPARSPNRSARPSAAPTGRSACTAC